MDEKMSNEFEIEILKQCYESLERTLDTTEKEREHYRVSCIYFVQVRNPSITSGCLFSNFINKHKMISNKLRKNTLKQRH